MATPTAGLLLQMLQQNDEKHEAAHARIRHDHRELESKHDGLEKQVTRLDLLMTEQVRYLEDFKAAMKTAQEAPIDIGKIVFNPKMVLAIVGAVLAVVSGNYFTNAPLRDKIESVSERVLLIQADITKQNERAAAVQAAVDDLKRQMEMRRLEIQNVSNDLQQIRRSK